MSLRSSRTSTNLYNDEASADAAALYNDAMYGDSEAADDRSFGQGMPSEDEMPDEDGDGGPGREWSGSGTGGIWHRSENSRSVSVRDADL